MSTLVLNLARFVFRTGRSANEKFRTSCILTRKCSGSVHTAPCVKYATLPPVHTSNISSLSYTEFKQRSEHVLEYLCNAFEDLSDRCDLGPDYDVSYSEGVLTIKFGPQHGTYVLNKQTPNKQIWLSSPKSGPKRYDYNPSNGSWIYHHDQSDLFELLSSEISEISKTTVVFKIP
ncbi:Frataxin mitochondrial [Taenia solium]|eukprot:TsM_000204700 transcript=TsM_000204700 gene=TsM_000204700